MDRKKIELIATIVLAIVFLVFLINTVKKVSKKPKAAPVVKRKIALTKHRKPTIKGSPAKSRVERAETKEEIAPLVWGRDPFVLLETDAVGTGGPISLGGIIWDKKRPKAMINNEIYKVGDKIGNIEIVDIKRNSVLIRTDGKTREISLD